MKKLFTCLSVLYLSVLLIGPTLADDFTPPDWRGDILTVQTEWAFNTDFTNDPDNVPPDLLITLGDGEHDLGDAVTHAHLDTLGWQMDPDNPENGWVINLDDVAHIADFQIVNWVDDYEFKHIWIQITWGGQGPAPFVTQVIGPNPVDNNWTDPSQGIFTSGFDPDSNHHIEYWVLMPNPDREAIDILIPPDTWIDQVMIDTICTQGEVDIENSTWGDIKALFR